MESCPIVVERQNNEMFGLLLVFTTALALCCLTCIPWLVYKCCMGRRCFCCGEHSVPRSGETVVQKLAKTNLRRIAAEKGEEFVIDMVNNKKDVTDMDLRNEIIDCYMKVLKVDSLE